MAEIPHFTVPFQWARNPLGGLRVSTVEQESTAEIAGCCEAILRTVQGQRTSLPEFGRPELEFSDPAFSQSAVAGALVEFEPRVESLVDAYPDDDDPEIQVVRALIAPRDSVEGDAT
jgi:phage baseplate assembly protein W